MTKPSLTLRLSCCAALPDRGLILDLRDNPGGFIWAAERLLQLFTPNLVTPTKFSWRATPLTAAMARAPFNQGELAPWAESLFNAQLTGEPYSSHLPITPYEQCNDLGQHYGGPVSRLSSMPIPTPPAISSPPASSTTALGPSCVSARRPAPAAQTFGSYDDLRAALSAAEHPLPKLPPGVGFTVAVRRAVRSGDADGTLIEDAGIPGQSYEMTRIDILGSGQQSNQDLIEHCGEILAAQPLEQARRRPSRPNPDHRHGRSRPGRSLPGWPSWRSHRPDSGDGSRSLTVPAGTRVAEVVGFARGVVRQRQRIRVDAKGP